MKYEAVIFDLFGTLIDNFSRVEYGAMLTEMAEIVGAPGGDFMGLWGDTVEQRMTGAFPTVEAGIEHLCDRLGVTATPSDLEAAAGARIEFTRSRLVPRDGALTTLRELRDAGRKIGLVTDCTLEVPMLWPETPFAALVDAPVFSCTARVKKPDAAIYRLACDALDVAPGACLYIGDGSSGELTGAAQVGMHPVLIDVPYDSPEEWERAEAEAWRGPTVCALSEVLAFVE
jgi:putative hydrolase of the HAD superfamily